MALLSDLELIRRIPLFSNLTVEQADALAMRVVKRRFRRGEALMNQGQQSHALFVLLSGRARVVLNGASGRQVVLAMLRAGDYAGEMSLIDGGTHSATVQAEVQCDVLILAQEDFARCLSDNVALVQAVLLGLAARLRAANRQIRSLALLDVQGRVAHALRDMSELDGADGGRRIIRGRVSRQGLARVVGASREMVSRVMGELEAGGMIRTLPDGSVLIDASLG